MHEFLRSRRSVRHFLPQPVPSDVLERILETAIWAPSAHNRQPWRFVVLTTPDARTSLVESMGAEFRRDLLADDLTNEEAETRLEHSRRRIMDAPVAILLCMEPSQMDAYPDETRQRFENLMALQSVALAGGTLFLAAHAEGLGGVWMCAPLFAPSAVCKALGLPLEWQPQGLILLGYPAKIPSPRPRKPLVEVVIYK